MIKITRSNRRTISQIVREYRILAGNSEREATLRAFAGSLSEALDEVIPWIRRQIALGGI